MSEEQQPFPAEGPDDPAYTGEDDPDQEQQKDQQSEGQVSEVQRLGEGGADTQVSPDDAPAG